MHKGAISEELRLASRRTRPRLDTIAGKIEMGFRPREDERDNDPSLEVLGFWKELRRQ